MPTEPIDSYTPNTSLLDWLADAEPGDIAHAIETYRSIGKFYSLTEEVIYEMSLDSSDTIGDVAELGHYTLIRFKDASGNYLDPEIEKLFKATDETHAACILRENGDGILEYNYFANIWEADAAWSSLEEAYAEFYAEQEDDDETDSHSSSYEDYHLNGLLDEVRQAERTHNG